MFIRKLTCALAMVLISGAWAGAAAPQLPDKAIGADTVMLLHMDGSTLTPDALWQAAEAVLGRNAASANEQIAKYQEKYDKAVKAGVQSLTFVAAVDNSARPDAAKKDDSPNNGIGYIQLKPGADAAAVQKMMTESMEPAQQAKMVFNREGDFLVMHEKNEKLPVAGDRARAAQFSEAINQAPAAGLVIVFVPNQAVRDKYEKEQKASFPPVLQQMAPAVLNSKWAAITFNVGKSPAVMATANTADETSAKQLTDGVNAGIAQVKQMARDAQNGQGANNNPLVMMLVPIVAPLTDALKPVQTGNQVTVALQGQPLQTVAQLAMNLSAMFGNMGGPRQGGPGPGRGPAGAPGRGQ